MLQHPLKKKKSDETKIRVESFRDKSIYIKRV